MTSLQKQEELIHFFQNRREFNNKDFDDICSQARPHVAENGLTENDLITISEIAFRHKLSSRRISNLMKILIPRTYIPDSVTRVVLKWLLTNSRSAGREGLRSIFYWLIGLVEYRLTNIDIINLYYELFFWFIAKDNPLATKLVYLLTKPSDVNRWYFKQVMRIHQEFNSGTTGAILYLYKTYKPECVPESIPAYAAHTVFSKLPDYFVECFEKAKERIKTTNVIPRCVDDIVWDRLQVYDKGVKAITLVPKTLVIDNEFNVNSTDFKSLKKVTNVKELQKYMLRPNTLDKACLMSLLNNSAGRHVVAFANNQVHIRLSFVLYYTLHDAFYNPLVSYKERDYFLQCLAMLQIHVQESIPVINSIVAQYVTVWDGHDHVQNISQLLQYIHFTTYQELQDCLLHYLQNLFFSGTVQMKCNVLKILGNLISNLIVSYYTEQESRSRLLFPDLNIEWDFEEVISELYRFTKKLCMVGFVLENGNCLFDHCVAHLHEKVLLAESQASIRIWDISPILSYSALFTNNPSLLCRVCDMYRRFPKAANKIVVKDYIRCLTNMSVEIEKESFFNNCSEEENRFIERTKLFISQLRINQHFAVSCYIVEGLNYKQYLSQVKEIFLFISDFMSNDKPKRKRKR